MVESSKKMLLLLGMLSVSLVSTYAQFFGISADAAINYTAAPEKVDGAAVGITHPIPFVPNIGAVQLKFKEKSITAATDDATRLTTDVVIESAHLFYHVPFPVITLALGAGAGTLKVSSKVNNYKKTIEKTTPVVEMFVRIGLPFLNFFDFHIGYHAFRMKEIKLTDDTFQKAFPDAKQNYSGALNTVGLQVAF